MDMGPSYVWVLLFLTSTRERAKIPEGNEGKTKTEREKKRVLTVPCCVWSS